jgi:hypothetical protein
MWGKWMSDQERIAVLETKIMNLEIQLESHRLEHKDLVEFIKKHMNEEDKRWKEIHEVMMKWKGFIGGVVFITSAIAGLIATFLHYFGNKFFS